VNFTSIILCVASQRAIPKLSICFVIDSVRKLLDTLSNMQIVGYRTGWLLRKVLKDLVLIKCVRTLVKFPAYTCHGSW
jgi:hypothetical protein